MLHIYRFHHHEVSEDMLLGLGAGIGFFYWHQKGMAPMLAGRGNVYRPGVEGLELTTGRRTGVAVERFHTSSRSRAEKTMLGLLEAGEPVMVNVDMGLLPYFDLPDDYHFGGHVIVVAGADAEQATVTVADRDADLHTVPLDQFAAARGSTFKPFPPHNMWYTFDFRGKRPPTAVDARTAIAEACATMLDGPIANIGVKGIRKAALQVPRWAKTMSDEQLRGACFNNFIFIDATGGTGGGIFRYMYSRFLREAVELTGDETIGRASQELHGVGDRWQEVAQLFHPAGDPGAADDPTPALAEIAGQLEAIADQEEAIWLALRRAV